MAEPLELMTSLDLFHDLHLLADGKAGNVKVDKQALKGLLIDHSTMIGALKGHGVTCRDPQVKVRRLRLID